MNFRKYAGIILNILVPLLTVYLVCVWGLRLVVFFISEPYRASRSWRISCKITLESNQSP